METEQENMPDFKEQSEQINPTMEAILSLTVNKANFQHMAETGKINGNHLAELRHILVPLYKDRDEWRYVCKEYVKKCNELADAYEIALNQLKHTKSENKLLQEEIESLREQLLEEGERD